jgi:hypothetical protein
MPIALVDLNCRAIPLAVDSIWLESLSGHAQVSGPWNAGPVPVWLKKDFPRRSRNVDVSFFRAQTFRREGTA